MSASLDGSGYDCREIAGGGPALLRDGGAAAPFPAEAGGRAGRWDTCPEGAEGFRAGPAAVGLAQGNALPGPAAGRDVAFPRDRSFSPMTIGPETCYRVRGGIPLQGTVFVQGAKNAALKMIAASLLADKGRTVLRNVPPIEDVRRAVELAQAIGARVEFHEAERTLVVDASTLTSPVLPAEIARRFRGSVLFVPALLHRFGEAVIEGIGGCNLGNRNLDFHYRGFARLGAVVDEGDTTIRIKASKLQGAHLYLDTPSHTGTENLIMAACLAPGRTVIDNTAQEPDVLDVIAFLPKMGARITGGGTGFSTVHGVDELNAVEHTVMADRIDAGVFAMAAAITGGEINLVGASLDHFGVFRWKLEQMGVKFGTNGAVVSVRMDGPVRPINVITSPYPGFATDLQSPIMALACLAEGATTSAKRSSTGGTRWSAS